MASAPATTNLPPSHRPSIRQKGAHVGGGTAAVGTPSPSWKEALKRDCLDRARRRRRDAVLRARGRPSPAGGGGAHAGAAGVSTAQRSGCGGGGGGDAKILVEEELRAKGVSVVAVPPASAAVGAAPPAAPVATTPAAAAVAGAAGYSTPLPGPTGGSARPDDGTVQALFPPQPTVDGGIDYTISVDEVYDLMREVEDELQREEARLVEELQAMDRQRFVEDRLVEEQISHYEQWEISSAGGGAGQPMETTAQQQQLAPNNGDDRVTCPECSSAYLIRTAANVILCPNAAASAPLSAAPTGSSAPGVRCNLRLDVTSEGLTLAHLREQLCRACSDHGATGCAGTLQFRTAAQFGVTTLVAGCEACQASAIIL